MKKILMVDDEADILELYSDILKTSLGDEIQITLAYNGADGINLSLKSKFDLIISDYRMPKINGINMLKTIFNNPQNPNAKIPALIITGYGGEVQDEIDKEPFDHDLTILEKPIEEKKLTEIVRTKLTNN